jgi:hypothetical protein
MSRVAGPVGVQRWDRWQWASITTIKHILLKLILCFSLFKIEAFNLILTKKGLNNGMFPIENSSDSSRYPKNY